MGKFRFIAIEGLDLVGKTTQAERLADDLGVDYIKGGGWQTGSKLAQRTSREGSRDHYFSLMQMKFLGDLAEKASEAEIAGREGVVGIVDRLVVVDIAHHLSKSWDETKKGFSKEAKEKARQSLKKFMPKGILGIVLDVSDKGVLEERINRDDGDRVEETESDTLNRFEAKRAAWLWCAQELGWTVINAEGTRDEVFQRIREYLGEQGVLPEGQKTAVEREN